MKNFKYKPKSYFIASLIICSITLLCGCSSKTTNVSSLEDNLETIAYASGNGSEINMPALMNQVLIPSQPVIQAEVPKTLASFSTSFSSWVKGRNKNITLAAGSINGSVINPGEIFSFNNAVGPTTKERGYKLAKVFFKGKETKGYGGGVCQVSSTLYNAAEIAGMEIVERHPHTREVTYVEPDRDAATSYGGIDLKLKNNYNFPIIISTSVKNDTITVNIDVM